MENDGIAEVCGIAADQNLDKNIVETDILENKLEEFPDKELYKKKTSDIKFLTKIENKNTAGEELTKEELKFLYEFDDDIVGFDYENDPRIKEIINTRNIKKDISLITGYLENEISLTTGCLEDDTNLIEEKFLNGEGKIKFHYGDLYFLELKLVDKLILSKEINGSIYFYNLDSAEGITFPEKMNGNLDLGYYLKSAEGLVLPKEMNGSLNLRSLNLAKELVLPKIINGWLNLEGLRSVNGLNFSNSIIKGIIHMYSLSLEDQNILKTKYPKLNFQFERKD